MFLVDTDVISASSPLARKPVASAVAWLESRSDQLFISVVTVAEISDGIAKLRREKATRKAANLAAWLDTMIHLYADRILILDLETARVAGVLSDAARGKGHAPGFADIIIAATARRHGFTVVTRNGRHFLPMDVKVFDPLAD